MEVLCFKGILYVFSRLLNILLAMDVNIVLYYLPFGQLCRFFRRGGVNQKGHIRNAPGLETIHYPLVPFWTVPKIISCHHQLDFGLRHYRWTLMEKVTQHRSYTHWLNQRCLHVISTKLR